MPLPDAFHALARQVNNWGRWGPDDQRGTLNLITDDAVRRGAAAIRTGRRFSLALPLSADGIQAGLVPGRDNPTHTMSQLHHALTGDPSAFASNDDRLELSLQAATHWDALAHVEYDGRLYNDRRADCVTEAGAAACSIDHVGPLASRGVLLDVARLHGLDLLEPGHAITAEELDAACERAGVTLEPGDVVLVRTGQMRHAHEGRRVDYGFPSPGLATDCAAWFHRHDVAAVAIDNLTFDVIPSEDPDVFLPLHLLHLVEMGLLQGQNWDLEELAEAVAEDGRAGFLLVAAPEPVVGAVGGLVHPVAIR